MKRLIIQVILIGVVILSFAISGMLNKMFFDGFGIKMVFDNMIGGSFKPVLSYFLTSGVLFLLVVIGAHAILKKKGLGGLLETKKDNLGSASFAGKKDFDGVTGNDGLIIGKSFRLSEKKSFEHFAIFGPTGSGKTVSNFFPNILQFPAHASAVISDPKGELFEKTARHALSQGKNVMIFSPFHSKTMRYNPLALTRNTTEIRELAQILLANGNAAIEELTGSKSSGGSEWTNMATPLLVAFLIFVRDLEEPNNTVDKALELIIENDLETLKILIEDSNPDAQTQMNIFLQSAESEKTASSIKTVLATGLQMFTDPMVKRVTAVNEIHPKALREHPTYLYVMVPEHKSAFMSPLMAPFYTQLFQYLLENGKGAPVHMLLDEFANIGIIPGIGKTLATIRSRRVSITLGIQSVNQLKQRYNEEANSILDNLKTKAFLPGLSYDSAEYASKMVGFKEVESLSTSYSKKQDNSYSVSKQKRELLSPDEVRRLADETILIITDNRNPFIDKQYRYYNDKKMVQATADEMTVEEFLEDY